MAQVQVILHGYIINDTFDTGEEPIILRFDEDGTYEGALWIVPSFPEYIPSDLLSEVRVVSGPATVVVEGPEGFASGPYNTTLVRTNYPSGKLVSFIYSDPTAPTTRSGVSLLMVEGSLIVEELSVGRPTPPPAAPSAG